MGLSFLLFNRSYFNSKMESGLKNGASSFGVESSYDVKDKMLNGLNSSRPIDALNASHPLERSLPKHAAKQNEIDKNADQDAGNPRPDALDHGTQGCTEYWTLALSAPPQCFARRTDRKRHGNAV